MDHYLAMLFLIPTYWSQKKKKIQRMINRLLFCQNISHLQPK